MGKPIQELAWAVVGSDDRFVLHAIQRTLITRYDAQLGYRVARVTILEERPCVWKRTDSAGIWETGCDRWQYEEAIGFPIMTEYPHCPRCRQRVEVKQLGQGEEG